MNRLAALEGVAVCVWVLATTSDANRNGILFEPLPAGSYTGTGADAMTFESDGSRNGATGRQVKRHR